MQKRMSGNATVVGVNADLFNWQLGYPSGIFMRDGVLHGRPTSARSSLGIGVDGLLRIARDRLLRQLGDRRGERARRSIS